MPDHAEVQRSIRQYYPHLHNRQYLDEVFQSVERTVIDRSIVELLCSGNAEDFTNTCLFIRDLVLLGPKPEECESLEQFCGPSVVSTLEDFTTAPNHHRRSQAIYTLGKIGSKSSLPALRRTFQAQFEKDPLLLPGLLFEIFWLEEKEDAALIEEAAVSAQYLTRWAILDVLDKRPSPEDLASPEWQLRVLVYARLLEDPHARVRAEAEYQHALLDFEAQYLRAVAEGTTDSAETSKAVRRAARREIERRRPSLCFADLEVRFYNHLHNRASDDYTVSELDEFVRSYSIKTP